MINFDKISWDQIVSFLKILQSQSINLDTLKRRYLNISENFDETLTLLKKTKIVRIVNSQVVPSNELVRDLEQNSQTLRDFFVVSFFENSDKLLYAFNNFFDDFVAYGSAYFYKPNLKKRLQYSGIRNFLININVLEFDPALGGYVAEGDLNKFLNGMNNVFSYNKFIKRHETERELGLATELLVYEYEKNLFHNNPEIQKKIKHVSLENVLAGYDISSFRKRGNELLLRYIEVKAVSSVDWKFYWSRNEILTAQRMRNNYFLYLVPVCKGKIKLREKLVIQDPFMSLRSSKKWKESCELKSFMLIE